MINQVITKLIMEIIETSESDPRVVVDMIEEADPNSNGPNDGEQNRLIDSKKNQNKRKYFLI